MSFSWKMEQPSYRPSFSISKWSVTPNSLHITEAEPLVDYLLSSFRFSELGDRRAELLAFIERELESRGGAIEIIKDSGIFVSS